MSIEVTALQKLPLNLILEGAEANKYPLAFLYNHQDTLLGAYPLTNVSHGYYTNYDFIPQLDDVRITARYVVYDDPTHTVKSKEYQYQTEDVFDINTNITGAGTVTNYEISIPQNIELPTQGSKRYRFVIYLYDKNGTPADPDNEQVLIHLDDIHNAQLVTLPTCIRKQVGVYYFYYDVEHHHEEQPLWAEFNFYVDSVFHLIGEVTEVIRTRSVLDVIETQRLTAQRALNLDNLDTTVSSRESDFSALSRHFDTLDNINQNEVKIDYIHQKLGTPTSSSLFTITELIHAFTSKIGIPINTTLAQDNIEVFNELLKLGSPQYSTIAQDLLALSDKLGNPITSIATDINSVKQDTSRIGIPTTGSLAQDNQHTWDLLGTPQTTISSDIFQVQDSVNDLNLKLGNPITGSLTNDINQVYTDTHSLVTNLTNQRISNLDNLDVPVSSVQSKSDSLIQFNSLSQDLDNIVSLLGALPTNHYFAAIVPQELYIPEASSKVYRFFVTIVNNSNSYIDPTSNIITYRLETVSGTPITSFITLTRYSQGQYFVDYTVNSSSQEQILVVKFNYTIEGQAFSQTKTTELVNLKDKLNTLLSRLTTQRAANLDNLNAPISLLETQVSADSKYTNLQNLINTTTTNTNTIITNTNNLELQLDQVNSQLTKLGNPVTTISSDINNLSTQLANLLTQVLNEFNQVDSNTNSIQTLINQVKQATDKIGTTITGTLTSDISLLNNRITNEVLTDINQVEALINNINNKLGNPVITIAGDITTVKNNLALVQTDISLIDNQVQDISNELNKIGNPQSGTISLDLTQIASSLVALTNLVNTANSRLGTPNISVSSDLASLNNLLIVKAQELNTLINQVQTKVEQVKAETDKIGTPVHGSIALDIANINSSDITTELNNIESKIDLIPTNTLLVTDTRLDNLDAPITSRATPQDVVTGSNDSNGVYELVGILDEVEQDLIGVLDIDTDLVGVIDEE